MKIPRPEDVGPMTSEEIRLANMISDGIACKLISAGRKNGVTEYDVSVWLITVSREYIIAEVIRRLKEAGWTKAEFKKEANREWFHIEA